MHGFWGFFWLAVILKIPIAALRELARTVAGRISVIAAPFAAATA